MAGVVEGTAIAHLLALMPAVDRAAQPLAAWQHCSLDRTAEDHAPAFRS